MTDSKLVHAGARLVDALTGRVYLADELVVPPGRGVVLVCAEPSVEAALVYLGAVEDGRAVIVLDPGLDVAAYVARFRPSVVAGHGPELAGYRRDGRFQVRVADDVPQPHPELAVLLATSGSTGDPKLVRLSRRGILSNARAITEVLGIDGGQVAPTTLPLYYTLGLSVLNSHMYAGATVVITGDSLLSAPFWASVDQHGMTSLTAVPAQFEMLRRIGFNRRKHPSLAYMATSGGRLRPELALEFAELMDGGLYLMYGQTEATARLTVLPPSRLREKPGSVGVAIPGSRVAIEGGEVVFRGPGVMMGYAERAEDLSRGDELGGVLATGDLGRMDDEGFLYLTGRIKRIAKVFGVRINLDDVEAMLTGLGAVAAVSSGERVVLWTEGVPGQRRDEAVRELAGRLRLHVTGFEARAVERLPLLGNGKIDYRALEAMTG